MVIYIKCQGEKPHIKTAHLTGCPKQPKARIMNIARSSSESFAQNVIFITASRVFEALLGHIDSNALGVAKGTRTSVLGGFPSFHTSTIGKQTSWASQTQNIQKPVSSAKWIKSSWAASSESKPVGTFSAVWLALTRFHAVQTSPALVSGVCDYYVNFLVKSLVLGQNPSTVISFKNVHVWLNANIAERLSVELGANLTLHVDLPDSSAIRKNLYNMQVCRFL